MSMLFLWCYISYSILEGALLIALSYVHLQMASIATVLCLVGGFRRLDSERIRTYLACLKYSG